MSRSTREQRNTAKIAARMAEAQSWPCILCGGRPTYVGLWTPTRPIQDQLGRPPGKTRLGVYSLCADCAKIPDPSTMIEDRIIAGHEATKYAVDRN